MSVSNAVWIAAGAFAVIAILVYRQNAIMRAVPKEVAEISPHRWTRKEIRDAYDRLTEKPIDFNKCIPPKLERRYVVVGGCGLVGGDIVLQLLQRGHSPESIRIIDFASHSRAVLLHGQATKVETVKADIASPASIAAAFSKPWPTSVSSLPLTVFHTAAVIRPWERRKIFFDRVERVNVAGTANVMAAAKDAGSDIFIATSSGSIALTPVSFWVWPWRSAPLDYVQLFDESDFDRPLRPHGRFFSNYAFAKAKAERLVCSANAEAFRTGTIRPVNGVYGDPVDLVVGPMLTFPSAASWTPHIIQNFVTARNVAVAHLQLEAALAAPTMPRCAGRTFNVSDSGPPPSFMDLYNLMFEVCDKDIKIAFPPPAVLFTISYLLEAWCLLLTYVPILKKLGLAEPGWPLSYLQPAVFTVAAHTIGSDALARKSVAEGGIGYRSACSSLEGFCEEVRDWNLANRAQDANRKDVKAEGKVAQKVVNAGLAPEPVAA